MIPATGDSYGNYFFGSIFLIVSLPFAIDLSRQKMHFALPQVDKIIYILLLFWAIPFPPFIQIPKYGVYEDTVMFVTGIFSLVLLLRYWKVPRAYG